MVKNGQLWSTMLNHAQLLLTLVYCVELYVVMVNHSQFQSTFIIHGQTCATNFNFAEP